MKKSKKNTPSVEQWIKLYEVASKIKLEAPWQFLYDTNLITIMLPGREEPIYVSVMGRYGDCFGISIYPGYRAVAGLYRLLESAENDSYVNVLSYQNCLVCYYGDRDELLPEERELIKSLGLKFRGKNNWIYFRSMKEGFLPWFINADEADILIQALQNFYMAYKHMSNGRIEVDFDAGKTLLRQYSPERKEWLNGEIDLLPVPSYFPEIVFTDELMLKRLQKVEKIDVSLELDILYLPIPIQEDPDKAPLLTRLLVLFDREEGFLVASDMIEAELKNEDAIFSAIIDFIQEYGKPKKIFVRDKYFLDQVKSLCSQIGIPTVHGQGMPCTEEFAEDMFNFMENF